MSDIVLNNIMTILVAPATLMLLKWLLERKGTTLKELIDQFKGIGNKIDNLEEASKVQGVAIRNIVRYRLIKNMSESLDRGYVSRTELQEIVNLYDSYKGLGGNSVVDKVYQDFIDLPIKEV